jgi:tRNA (cytosine34-C5)-methyltransferase
MFGNNDADSKQHKKRKRNNNPLSKARGKRTNENIWFRRSKAGFSLFVQYYMSQPVGTISNTIERKRSTIDISLPVATIAKNSKIKGEGMSRAAKRRKKKNKKRQNTRYVPESDYEPDQAINDVNSCITLERQKINALPYLVAEYSKLVNTSGSTNNMNVEFEAFLRTMSRPLPLSFRLRKLPKNSDFEDAIDRLDGKDFSKLVEAISFGNTTLYRAQSNDNKFQLCKENLNLISPALKEFLVDTSQLGMIARQEIGSMLPVLALHGVGSLQVGRRVLDMCASPGSKTLQALEIVGQKGRYALR